MQRQKRSAENSKEKEKTPVAAAKKQKEAQEEKGDSIISSSKNHVESEEDVLERVRVLDRAVRESRQNINNCVELVSIVRDVRFSVVLPFGSCYYCIFLVLHLVFRIFFTKRTVSHAIPYSFLINFH